MNAPESDHSQVSLADTRYFSFRNAQLQRRYEDFRSKHVPLLFFSVVLLAATCMQIYGSIVADSAEYKEVMLVVRCLRIVFILPAWFFLRHIYRIQFHPTEASPLVSAHLLGDISILSFVATL